jgi:predicted nicotinamide N-methyase
MLLSSGHTLQLLEQPEASIGSYLWPGAHLLSSFLQEQPALVAGLRVLELGAGCGLCGLAARCLGASSVLLTDRAAEVRLLQHNLQLNAAALGGSACALELEWGSEGWQRAAEAVASWGAPQLLLASDCVYKEEVALLLVETLQALMPAAPAPACCLLLAYKERGAGKAFFAAMQASGFCRELLRAAGEHSIFRFRRL